MSTQEAVAVAHDPIYLDDVGNGLVAVREKYGNGFTNIGAITFKNDKAIRLSRDLKSFPTTEAKDVGQVLFQGVERLKHDDPTVSVSTREVFMSSESGTYRGIIIGTGRRRLEIALSDGPNTDMTISEVLVVLEALPSR